MEDCALQPGQLSTPEEVSIGASRIVSFGYSHHENLSVRSHAVNNISSFIAKRKQNETLLYPSLNSCLPNSSK
jgi:hypothetical protein